MADTVSMSTPEIASRLRKARLAAGLGLADIEQRTRISPSILRLIDEGRFDRLPAGIYARAYIRAYASAVGLEPEDVLRALEPALPPAAELVPEPAAPRRAISLGPGVRTTLAAALDAGALSALWAVLLAATAGVAGLPVGELPRVALPAVLVMGAIVTMLYFVVFAGIEGRTPGARVAGVPPPPPEGAIGIAIVARRAAAVFLAHASLTVELAVRRTRTR